MLRNELRNNKVGMLVLVAALGYFVDIYDLVLFGMERTSSLKEILQGVFQGDQLDKAVQDVGLDLFNVQMIGMLIGGIAWGIIGDKKGRLSVLFGSIITYSIANILNGFVHDTTSYGILRFISGFGLAGELGAGITLVSESMSKENRGWGTMIVASVGLVGAVVAGLIGNIFDNWRVSYWIGGGLGMILLFLRLGLYESGMFSNLKKSSVRRGDIRMLFSSRKNVAKYFNVILIALPVWYVMGILMQLCPEIAKEAHMNPAPIARNAITIAYAGITVGDIVSGWLSQRLKSRKKSLLLFMSLTILFTVGYFLFALKSIAAFYTVTVLIGFATGYWAVFMSSASELFGTNIRSTVTTTAPNFVRGGAVILTLSFQWLSGSIGMTKFNSAILIGVIVFGVGIIAWYFLEETYGKNLDYVEETKEMEP